MRSKFDQLRDEVSILKLRLKTARDKEILLLTQIMQLKRELEIRNGLAVRQKASETD